LSIALKDLGSPAPTKYSSKFVGAGFTNKLWHPQMILVNPPPPNFIDFTTGDRPSCASLFAALGAIV